MIEYNLPDIPDAVRVYPASAATVMYPMTPGNNWTSTMLFCGGNDLKSDQWVTYENNTWVAMANSKCVWKVLGDVRKLTPTVRLCVFLISGSVSLRPHLLELWTNLTSFVFFQIPRQSILCKNLPGR